MDLNLYFKRIGFTGSLKKTDLETLKLIHKQHVMSVPFENLSIHCGEKINMDLEFIFDKIVNRNRGGVCLENNLLFAWVLQKMGYKSTMLAAWVYSNTMDDFGLPDIHLINKVDINGKSYIADVSFGMSGQIWEPLEFVLGKEHSQSMGVFRFLDIDNKWVLEKTGRLPKLTNPEFGKSFMVDAKLTKQIYGFTLEPRVKEHFYECCQILQTHPALFFTNKSLCSLQTTTGFKVLIGWTYCEVTYKPGQSADDYEMKKIPDEEIELLLIKEFNLKLPRKLQPANRKGYFIL